MALVQRFWMEMQSLPDTPGTLDRLAPLEPHKTAYFFDFDGTLVELAATPDGVIVEPRVRHILSALQHASGGAVAIVSGRGIASIDSLLAPLVMPAAGLHGAEHRGSDGATQRLVGDDPRIAQMQQVLEQTVHGNPGLLLEVKGAALALHYRNAPTKADVARAATEQLVARYPGAFVLQPGKMVFEIKPANVDKGRAIALFLDEAPFAGRTPFFAGDDLTDEKGFAVVNQRGGVSVKVGAGGTVARARVASVGALLDWLGETPGAGKPGSTTER
jgi:trehalose 6-phosphate phosphatase